MKRDTSNIPQGTCICSVCNEEKDNLDYSWYRNRHTQDGYRLRANTNCSDCRKRLRKELSDIRKTIIKSHPQPPYGSSCDLCNKPVHKNWQLDHCHETGKFRGWLCKGCNTGLGGIGDSFESSLKALIYLSKFKGIDSKQLHEIINQHIN